MEFSRVEKSLLTGPNFKYAVTMKPKDMIEITWRLKKKLTMKNTRMSFFECFTVSKRAPSAGNIVIK